MTARLVQVSSAFFVVCMRKCRASIFISQIVEGTPLELRAPARYARAAGGSHGLVNGGWMMSMGMSFYEFDAGSSGISCKVYYNVALNCSKSI